MKQCIASASAISNALKISGVDDEDNYDDDPLEDSPFLLIRDRREAAHGVCKRERMMLLLLRFPRSLSLLFNL